MDKLSKKAKAPKQEKLEQVEQAPKQISKQVAQVQEPRASAERKYKKEIIPVEKPLLEKREIKPELKAPSKIKAVFRKEITLKAVSYTHLTLPTICSV